MLQLKNALTTDVKTTVTIFLIVSPNNCYAIVMEFFIEHNMHICILPKAKKQKQKTQLKTKQNKKTQQTERKDTCIYIHVHPFINIP